VGLERGPLSLVSTFKGLLERKDSGSGLEIREYGRREIGIGAATKTKLSCDTLMDGRHHMAF
jgi:hypothetical protein